MSLRLPEHLATTIPSSPAASYTISVATWPGSSVRSTFNGVYWALENPNRDANICDSLPLARREAITTVIMPFNQDKAYCNESGHDWHPVDKVLERLHKLDIVPKHVILRSHGNNLFERDPPFIPTPCEHFSKISMLPQRLTMELQSVPCIIGILNSLRTWRDFHSLHPSMKTRMQVERYLREDRSLKFAIKDMHRIELPLVHVELRFDDYVAECMYSLRGGIFVEKFMMAEGSVAGILQVLEPFFE